MFCDIGTREIKKYFKSKHLEKRFSPETIFDISTLRCQFQME